jgi:ADP-heptose:LPS heptosyltransferase/GT2 family glycosyltransferase
MSAPRTVLLCKVDTLGDLVLFAPALRALRFGWPLARLAVLIRRAYRDLAPVLETAWDQAGGPAVEWLETTLDPFSQGPEVDPAELARLRQEVARLQPEMVVAATSRPNWLEAVLAAAAPPAARRLALGRGEPDAFFATRLRTLLGLDPAAAFSETVAAPADEPDWRRNLRLAAALLGSPVEPLAPTLRPPDAGAMSVLSGYGLAAGRYAVCAAAGFANVRLKTWPPERFAAALAHLRERHALPTLLVGHEAEADHLRAIPGAAACWLGREGDLPLLAALIARSALFLGNDTGALHLAAAAGVPVVAVFGGGTWPRFVPAARRGVALVHPLPCFGCDWDCAFGDAPCLGAISAADVTAALDQALVSPSFEVRAVDRLAAETRAAMDKAAATHRAQRADHLARQHKLEELTQLDREKDVEIQRQHAAVAARGAAVAEKEREIAALKAVCDEREKTIFILDGHVRHFQAENNQLKADVAIAQRTLAALPADAAHAARVIADQLVHIRNLEALRRQHEERLAELEAAQANRAAGLHDLEQAKHYGRLLSAKESVIQALSRGLAQRDDLLNQIGADTTSATARLRTGWRALRLRFRERCSDPLGAWLFRQVVEKHWMQIGVLRHYDPRPLAWDRRLPRPRWPAPRLPRLAVVTPSFGQERFLERTLRSVLDQEYPQLLYVVQDGGSRDRSPEIIARHAARLRHWESVPDQGQADAVHRGFAHVAGDLAPDDIMAWLNSDDRLGPGTLRFVGEYFATHPAVDVIYGHRIIIDEEDREVGRWIMPRHNPATLEWIDYVPQETLFWRKRAWDLAGGIDPSFQFALDWDLLARFQQAGCRLVRVPYFLGAFRVHAEQKTSQAIHTTGADEMRRIRTRFHGERQDDVATIERHAREARFWGAITARLLALGLRW